jgi:U3 small nucleolar RNA-associated protein 20
MCLKSLISRKFLSADIYDLMETVEDMMVTCVQKNIKTTCASIFIQFILEYPLEEKRLEQHINHMIKNLTYFDSEGRMQLLDVFGVLMDKFPIQVIDTYSELIFLTMFLRVVNDPN